MEYAVVQAAEPEDRLQDVPLNCCPYGPLSSWLEPLDDADSDDAN